MASQNNFYLQFHCMTCKANYYASLIDYAEHRVRAPKDGKEFYFPIDYTEPTL